MWNLHKPSEIRPCWWTSVDEVYEQPLVISSISTGPLKMNDLCSIMSSERIATTMAPKPPKKRFLEAAAAHQLRQQQLLQQQQQQQQQNGSSSLMQFAEVCFNFQKSGESNRSWSPAGDMNTTPCRTKVTDSVAPVVYRNSSPKAAATSWGWANAPDPMNEEPLDLSGEETIRTNQQDLIDHLVEKLCSQSPKSSMNSPTIQVSSTVLDVKTDVSSPLRKDLPLKKRDPVCMEQPSSDTLMMKESKVVVAVVSSSSSGKPAPRSCKGKRYLEFMYEGRIPLGSRVRRMVDPGPDPVDPGTTDAADPADSTSNVNAKTTKRHSKKQAKSSKTSSVRGRRTRKLS